MIEESTTFEELHRAQEQQQQLAAAGSQQRKGLDGHEMSPQNWTDQYISEINRKWTD